MYLLRRAACALATAACLTGATARASSGYPGAVREGLALSHAPACSLCHSATADADGGIAAADRPFALSMKARGLVGGDDLGSVARALVAIERERVDSDGDGAIDTDELAWGGDPNAADLPAAAPSDRIDPSYGCAAAPLRGKAGGRAAVPALTLSLLALVLGRRRRARGIR